MRQLSLDDLMTPAGPASRERVVVFCRGRSVDIHRDPSAPDEQENAMWFIGDSPEAVTRDRAMEIMRELMSGGTS